MMILKQRSGRNLVTSQPASKFGLVTCVAIDAGCIAASGLAGGVAFGFAWLLLKAGSII